MKKVLFTPILGLTPAFMLVFALFAFLFHFNPQWDLGTSAYFYNPDYGFYLKDSSWVFGDPIDKTFWSWLVYRGVHFATGVLLAVLSVAIAYSYAKKREKVVRTSRKALVYMLIVFILGPGITVNYLLKDNVGRARPAHVVEFGGSAEFTPAFTPSNQCERNCSFVSGHASFGYYWVVLGFLAGTLFKRCIYMCFGVAFGLGIGIVRVMQGRHFLSDIVLAFFFVYIVAAITHWLMYERRPD